jgi:hypothetical protein
MPKVSSLKKAGFSGDLKALAREASSSGDGASGLRQTAADLTRRYRKTGQLSAVARLTQLDARLTAAIK